MIADVPQNAVIEEIFWSGSDAGAFTTSLEDHDGCKSLLVLPSDQPCSRRDVQAVEVLVTEMLEDPAQAAARCPSQPSLPSLPFLP